MPMPDKSHFRGFQPLFVELSRRGHNVTVASSYPLESPVANYTDVGPFVLKEKVSNLMELAQSNFMSSVTLKWQLAVRMSEQVMPHRKMTEFVHSDSGLFDLVMVETFCQEYTVAMGHKYGAPVINLAPAMLWPSVSKWLHVPSTFSYIPYYALDTTDEMGFVDRLKNTVTGAIQLYAESYWYMPKMNVIMDRYLTYAGWESRPSLERMLGDVSLTLVNSHHAIGIARPYLPGVVDVGGMHIKRPKPLPENLQTFIASAEQGVIYFSFGTVVDLNQLPTEKMNIFLKVIGRLKQKTILKWTPTNDSAGLINLPRNILIGSWFPQNDILAHPNVRLFITHGGLHSLEEAIYNAKPLVGISFFADQHFNMNMVEKKGYGKKISYFEMTEQSLENAIGEVLSNPAFGEKAAIHSQVYRDQPTKPLDRAVYWVEYVIRNGGAGHLKSDSVGLNDQQYFLVDVSLILLVPIGLITWFCYAVVAKIAIKKSYNFTK
ncbi:Hypothetical protein CINCED_3A012882 [Cinara cedri]|nr:Hypothetical protein CINCED_3A012882 [Cinara cedri]